MPNIHDITHAHTQKIHDTDMVQGKVHVSNMNSGMVTNSEGAKHITFTQMGRDYTSSIEILKIYTNFVSMLGNVHTGVFSWHLIGIEVFRPKRMHNIEARETKTSFWNWFDCRIEMSMPLAVTTQPVYLRRAGRAPAPRAGPRAGRVWALAVAAAGSACAARRVSCSRAPLPTPLCPSATSSVARGCSCHPVLLTPYSYKSTDYFPRKLLITFISLSVHFVHSLPLFHLVLPY